MTSTETKKTTLRYKILLAFATFFTVILVSFIGLAVILALFVNEPDVEPLDGVIQFIKVRLLFLE